MSLKSVYDAELQKKQEAELSQHAARLDGVERLRRFHAQILEDGLPVPITEIEFADQALMIDPGPIMITTRVAQDGSFRLFYEVKSPDEYREIEVPGIASTDDLEREIARLLVEYRP